ncbi:MAG TPA: hypothetical protein DEB39_14885 [Planctomycetaceae bacterium]|nr:hypothetical protein [Planctomycetaceae bacterium]
MGIVGSVAIVGLREKMRKIAISWKFFCRDTHSFRIKGGVRFRKPCPAVLQVISIFGKIAKTDPFGLFVQHVARTTAVKMVFAIRFVSV